MKVLICVRRLDQGGAEMLECRLAEELNKIGIHADIAGQYSPDLFNGKNCAILWKEKGVPEILWIYADSITGILFSIIRVVGLIKSKKYDVVITHNSGLDIIIGIANLFSKFKHVIAFHDYLSNSNKIGLKFKLWKLLLQRADCYYSITQFVKRNIETHLGLDTYKNYIVYNSISFMNRGEKSIDLRRELNLPFDSKILLSAGRITANKGLDLTLEIIKDELKNSNTYLIIAGDALSDEEKLFKERLTQKISNYNLEKKVILLGFRKDIMALMKSSDAFIHIARHEGFGLVILEAIYAGIPIITSNVGGIPEVIQNTPYKSFELHDKEGILKEVKFLTSISTEERKRITNEAKKILPYYTDERRAKEISELLVNIK